MANIISYKDAGISVFSNTIRALLTYFALSSDGTVIFSKKLLFYLLKMEEPEMIKTRHSHLMKKIEVALQELMDHKEIDLGRWERGLLCKNGFRGYAKNFCKLYTSVPVI